MTRRTELRHQREEAATTAGPASAVVETLCPTCGGRVHVNDPKTPDGASLRAWDRALRSRQRRQDGVTDGRRYRTRRDAEDRAASYRRQLADRGLETESVVRRHYMHYGRWVWRVVLWRKGHRPGQVVERALAARERAKAKREAENIERGWW